MKLLAAILLLFTTTAAWAQFAHQPPGSAVIVDCPMVTTSACGLVDVYDSLEQGSEASSGMTSAPSTLTSILRANQSSGGAQVEKTFDVANEMYVSITFRTGDPFPSFACCANKMWFMKGPLTNGFFGLGTSSGSAEIYFGHNTGVVNEVQLDNSHACAGDYGLLGCLQNVGNARIVHGQFHELEVYMKASTSPTSRDGVLRAWNNGAPIMEYGNLNYPGGFNVWQWTETYSGPTAAQDRAFVIDHVRVAIPSCGDPCATETAPVAPTQLEVL